MKREKLVSSSTKCIIHISVKRNILSESVIKIMDGLKLYGGGTQMINFKFGRI